jgi:hypothetical protein
VGAESIVGDVGEAEDDDSEGKDVEEKDWAVGLAR